MDKFGIFELLDTLSQLTADTKKEDPPTDGAPAPRPCPDDKSFLPPDFGDGNNGEQSEAHRKALDSLYERHESISKRIDKNK